MAIWKELFSQCFILIAFPLFFPGVAEAAVSKYAKIAISKSEKLIHKSCLHHSKHIPTVRMGSIAICHEFNKKRKCKISYNRVFLVPLLVIPINDSQPPLPTGRTIWQWEKNIYHIVYLQDRQTHRGPSLFRNPNDILPAHSYHVFSIRIIGSFGQSSQ